MELNRRQFLELTGGVAASLATSALLAACSIKNSPEPEQPPNPAEIEERKAAVARKIRGLQDHVQVEPSYDQEGNLSEAVSVVDPEALKPLSPEVEKKVRNAVVKIGGSIKGTPAITEQASGFLMYDEKLFSPVVMAPGSVVSKLEPSSLIVDSRIFQYNTFASVEYANQGGDNLAKLLLPEAHDFESTALKARDFKANPIEFGEQFYAVTVPGGHEARDPEIFPVVYVGTSSDGRFATVIEGIDPNKKYDEVGIGDIGSMVVDLQGRVVGMISRPADVSGSAECGTGPVTSTNGSYFGYDKATIEMFVHKVGDVCEPNEVPSVFQDGVRLIENGSFSFFTTPEGWQ